MQPRKSVFSKWFRYSYIILASLAGLYLLLLVPEGDFEVPAENRNHPFVWDQDELWESLEALFQKARAESCSSLEDSINGGFSHAKRLLGEIAGGSFLPEEPIYDTIESSMFRLAARVAACPHRLPGFINLFSLMRKTVKDQSQLWNMDSVQARHRLYRLLFGGRAAVEEIMLQASPESVISTIQGYDEPSQTPRARIMNITVHSGDILVSRGGAPTSALIARGNDYPGNFSHVALAHVDEKTGKVTIIESHIESGVGISTINEYLRDEKLRIMVLRLRSDLPRMISDPLLPHKAASAMLAEAQKRHLAYDFEMDFDDNSKYFCSEVASAPYRKQGINLWMGISRISSLKLRLWLAALGVRHFETQEPSDLEYDPQLRVVGEWRDREKLFKDHLDNAVLDAMLEGPDSIRTLEYSWFMLPLARIVKAYSMLKNLFNSVGPVPEGMSATAALRVESFSERHMAIKQRLTLLSEKFRKEQVYTPPYWVLVNLARQAKKELKLMPL